MTEIYLEQASKTETKRSDALAVFSQGLAVERKWKLCTICYCCQISATASLIPPAFSKKTLLIIMMIRN